MLIISKWPNHFQPFFLDDRPQLYYIISGLVGNTAATKHMGISHEHTDVALKFMLNKQAFVLLLLMVISQITINIYSCRNQVTLHARHNFISLSRMCTTKQDEVMWLHCEKGVCVKTKWDANKDFSSVYIDSIQSSYPQSRVYDSHADEVWMQGKYLHTKWPQVICNMQYLPNELMDWVVVGTIAQERLWRIWIRDIWKAVHAQII